MSVRSKSYLQQWYHFWDPKITAIGNRRLHKVYLSFIYWFYTMIVSKGLNSKTIYNTSYIILVVLVVLVYYFVTKLYL